MLGTEPGPLQDQQAVSSALRDALFKENTFKTGLKGDFWSFNRKHKDNICYSDEDH